MGKGSFVKRRGGLQSKALWLETFHFKGWNSGFHNLTDYILK